MNILIPNKWLREFLQTNATPKEFAHAMSLSSVSIERMEQVDDDIVFDIEVTTNRPDLMSIEGLAKEAAAVLPQAGFKASYLERKDKSNIKIEGKSPILHIDSDRSLVNRILAIVMEVQLKKSPEDIASKIEKSGIRSINNVVDVTNYIMREVGHPSHVFDYDRLRNHSLFIRRSKKGERITTLDGMEYELPGNDIVADDGNGQIVDLLGIMGTANSVVVDDTKSIVLFLDNNNHTLLRNTSMNLGIRTEAAVLNEKGLDPELMMPTLLRGIALLEKIANAKAISPIIDIYPNKVTEKKISISKSQIDKLVGVEIPEATITGILNNLSFGIKKQKDKYEVTVPTARVLDMDIAEDIVEEIARVYGYHRLPNTLPPTGEQSFYHQSDNEFYWIAKVKDAFKYWGFNEVYTYSMVSESSYEGPIENAVKIKNPLSEDRAYLRGSLLPSLLEVGRINKNRESIRIFEISNVYNKKSKNLPDEIIHIALLMRQGADFYDAKGIAESIFFLLGLKSPRFKIKQDSIRGAEILYDKLTVGYIEEDEDVMMEMDLSVLLQKANSKKVYSPPPKFPPVIEDIRVEFEKHISFESVSKAIRDVNSLIDNVVIYDEYKNKKITYRITYQSHEKNLTTSEIAPIREKVIKVLEDNFKAKVG